MLDDAREIYNRCCCALHNAMVGGIERGKVFRSDTDTHVFLARKPGKTAGESVAYETA